MNDNSAKATAIFDPGIRTVAGQLGRRPGGVVSLPS